MSQLYVERQVGIIRRNGKVFSKEGPESRKEAVGCACGPALAEPAPGGRNPLPRPKPLRWSLSIH